MVAKKRKPPIKKRKPPIKKRKGHISGSSFTHAELKKYVNAIKKLRKNKRGKKKKKVGITNMTSFLNLLYNAHQERQYRYSPYSYRRRYPYRYKRRNLMRGHPFSYPRMIRDADVDQIWNATKLPNSKTKDGIITNLNEVYRQLTGFELLKSLPSSKPPAEQRGNIRIGKKDDDRIEAPIDISNEAAKPVALPSQPSSAPPIRKPRSLPIKPSSNPPPVRYDYYDTSSEDEEDENN